MRVCTKGMALAFLLVSACGAEPSEIPQQENGAAKVVPASASPEVIAAEISNGNFGRAAELARAAAEGKSGNPEIFLLLARAEARLNNTGYAVEALDKAFENGFHDPRGAVDHPDFDKIRNASTFRSLLKKWSISAAASPAPRASQSAPSSVTRAGDVSIIESGGKTRIQAGDVVIED
jgi:hypothetical protein